MKNKGHLAIQDTSLIFPDNGSLLIVIGERAEDYYEQFMGLAQKIADASDDILCDIKRTKHACVAFFSTEKNSQWWYESPEGDYCCFGYGLMYAPWALENSKAHFANTLTGPDKKKKSQFWNNLQGRYALGMIDQAASAIRLRTDPYGQAQLFKTSENGLTAFATDIRYLLKFRENTAINTAILPQYLILNYPLLPQTFYKEVTALRPGYEFVLTDGKVEQKAIRAEPQEVDYFEYFEKVTRLFSRKHKTLWHLSGGIDSTLLCAYALKANSLIDTITAYYQADHSDALYGNAQAVQFNSNHTTLQLDANRHHRILTQIMAITASPVMAVGVPTFFELAEQAAKMGVESSISGVGGDHIFTGYKKKEALETTGFLGTFANVIPDLVETYFLPGVLDHITRRLREELPAAVNTDLPIPNQIESCYRIHFLHEHLRMANACFGHFSTAFESPFLDEVLIHSGMQQARHQDKWKEKEYYREVLRDLGCRRAASRQGKSQMALEGLACLKAIAPHYLELMDTKQIIIEGLNYEKIKARLLASQALPKSEWRFIWITYNLHLWLQINTVKHLSLSTLKIQ